MVLVPARTEAVVAGEDREVIFILCSRLNWSPCLAFQLRNLCPCWLTALPKVPVSLAWSAPTPALCVVSCFLLGITLIPSIGLF